MIDLGNYAICEIKVILYCYINPVLVFCIANVAKLLKLNYFL